MKALKMILSNKKFRALAVLSAILAVFAAFGTISLVASAQGGGGGQTSAAASTALAKALGSGLAVGLAGIGGGYAVGVAGAAAISAVVEKREVSGTALLFVALGEGIAIYGLLVALLVLFVI